MPKEFMVPDDEDHEPELEEAMAQLNLEPLQQHLRSQKMIRGNILRHYS
jgi:hypothetical protein